VNLKKPILTALLFLQAGLVVTGGAVRLTGSGLGCPTWPECTKGSIAPVAHQAQGALHSWIEFGNRLLTFALVLAALFALIGAFRWKLRADSRKRVRILAAIQFLGIFAQGVLGGITVLTKLNPIPVAGHFLLSIGLISGALSLRQLVLEVPSVKIEPVTRKLSAAIIAVTLLVLTIGTVVTGSGPHAGDAQAKRFPFNPKSIAWLHADLVIALLALTLGLILVVKVSESIKVKEIFAPAVNTFFAIALGQGVIGYIQYFTKLPELIVGAHLLGATLVWISLWNIHLKGSVMYKDQKIERAE
jgi:cytochrome c oxidase assembly protein subunit 15